VEHYYIEIELNRDFNVIVETLTRIGILKPSTNELYQSCHLFHNEGKYYITHFKELFSMYGFINEGKVEEEKIHMTEIDFHRRNSIIYLLATWGLIEPKDNEYINENKGNVKLTVIPYKEKSKYTLVSKFQLGKK